MILLATLRPPPKTRGPARLPFDLASLGMILVADDAARLLLNTDDRLEIAVDTGIGQSLSVTVMEGEIRIMAEPDDGAVQIGEEHGGPVKAEDTVTEEAASELCCTLQGATGWHVESDHLLGFDPSGLCPTCHIECFEWQDRCAVCDGELEREDPTEDDDDRARHLLQSLLQEELIELTTRRGARSVESSLSTYLANGWGSPVKLLELLVELKEVAEVFASEADLARLLTRSPARGAAPGSSTPGAGGAR